MDIDDSTAPVLITGGTGTTGRRVAQRLTDRGVPVRVASRAGAPTFDWQDQTTWPAVVDGAGSAYLCFSPDLAVPGAAETVGAFARLAVERGVSRLVLLSGRGEPGAQEGERLVIDAAQAGGAAWTVVRSAWFAQNFTESFLADGVRAGHLVLPVGQVGEPFVDVEDVADVTVAALLEPGHDRRIHEVAAATGRPARFETITGEQLDAALAAAGAEEDVRWLTNHLFTHVLDGRGAHITDGVQRALGRPARDFTAHLDGSAGAVTVTAGAGQPVGAR